MKFFKKVGEPDAVTTKSPSSSKIVKETEKIKKSPEALIFLLVGFLCILIAVFMHTAHIISTSNEYLLFINETVVQITSHFGVGFLAIGILTYALEMKHWTNYFETRLSKIVTNKEYLQKLKEDDLIELQTEVLKAYFKNDEIGGSDGFLRYYQKNIQNVIGMPFRKNVTMNLDVIDNQTKNCIEVVEILTYVCIPNNGKMQSNICYIPDPGEHTRTISFDVTIQHDDLVNTDGADEKGKIFFNYDELKKLTAEKNKNKNTISGFDLDISKYNKPGLSVMVKAHYQMEQYRFIGWRMSHPTQGLILTLRYPQNMKLSKEYYFNHSNSIIEDIDDTTGRYYLTINRWLMPEEGLTLQVLPYESKTDTGRNVESIKKPLDDASTHNTTNGQTKD